MVTFGRCMKPPPGNAVKPSVAAPWRAIPGAHGPGRWLHAATVRVGARLILSAVIGAMALCVSFAVRAEDGTALDRYLDGLKTLRTGFQQRVVDAQGKDVEHGSGSLLVQRPGRFRWEYTPSGGGPQLLVADAKNLWFYDRDLDQVTVKPVAAALSTTPVTLLSGSTQELKASFEFSAQGTQEDISWVRVKPRHADADFGEANLGFTKGELVVMRIQDKLGQIVTLTFVDSRRNVSVAADALRFTPPKGVDIIGTPSAGAER